MKYQYKNFQQLMLLRLVRLQKYNHEESGFVLVIVISMVLILTSLLAAYGLLSKIETASTKSSVTSNTGFYAAEAGLNLRAKQVRDKFNGFNRPTGTPPGTAPEYLDALQKCLSNTGSLGSGDFICKRQTFNNQELLSYVIEHPDNFDPTKNIIQINSGEPFAGLSAQEYRYDVTSVALNSQEPSAILGMRFKSRLIPLFQFVVFYNNDAEFTVPPDMNLNGPIHSNGDLYLNVGNSRILTINGVVSTAGKLYRGEKVASQCGGKVNIYTVLDSVSSIKELSCGSGRTEYTQSQVSDWKKNILVTVPKLEVPEPDALDAKAGKDYWDKADLRIVLKLDSSSGNPSGIEIRNQDKSVDTTKTKALLESCPTNTTTTTLRNELDGTSNYEQSDVDLIVNSITGFAVGNVVRVGNDYDSNIITSINPLTNTIRLKRRLGHTYQSATVASKDDIVSKVSVSTSNTFYNYREKNGGTTGNDGTYIRMLNVDVRGLLDCIHSQSLMGSKALNDVTENGLVWFLTVDGPNSETDVNSSTAPNNSNNYAVRLYNGDYLYSGQSGAPEIKGLTIVSDQAVYIQGNYNLKDDSTTTGINEGDNLATTTVTERWRPASILADTINILSKKWQLDDSNGRTYSTSNVPSGTIQYDDSRRTAEETTVNAAFLSGTTITGGKNGTDGQDKGSNSNSGGVNNYPRFHEHWNGTVKFNYKGSFVSLNAPRRTNSPFCGSYDATNCNIYSPPQRNWDFDSDFKNAANLPPLAPRFVYLRQEVFSRSFER
ncbi:hypothetical protein [Aliterella atlantica]|uniref:Type 4 fimbrial biogenesis protein PilX N-terminal domain-containing protein n=1 Tax=Aliterella atlantica CENA595 TaxID=1618023 RepID=A0A0D8ZYG0_9CYAN|nr:hypothetical protein [Aliterella atlantica]KJH72236.1 hypothetical protein UH38_07275 [Aliterella atlantica CENA595]